MTAFGRYEGANPLGAFIWELKSVNHRYLDASIKLPESFKSLESMVRERLRKRFARGKFEVILSLQTDESRRGLEIDHDFLKGLLAAATEIQQVAEKAAPLSVQQLMHWPGTLKAAEIDTDAVQQSLEAGLDAAIDQLLEARESEGVKMAALIDERLVNVLALVEDLEQHMPQIIAAHQDKLKSKLADLQIELEEERLAQEVVLLAQKSDVAEELDRLRAHVEAVRKAMSKGEPCGRRLDFLMQELNREANTLGSKSISIENSNGAIDLKVWIEQMREQVQNIE